MNVANSTSLPLVALPQPYWYRCVPRPYAYLPPRAGTARTRFNDGTLRVLYFAPDDRVAMFEARALLGSFFHAAVPAPGVRHAVVRYHISLGSSNTIVDAREHALPSIQTTIQEMTGDWLTYPRQYPAPNTNAPTQDLARAVYHLQGSPMGLIAPSARNPLANNLILFRDRLPRRSVSVDPQSPGQPHIGPPPSGGSASPPSPGTRRIRAALSQER